MIAELYYMYINPADSSLFEPLFEADWLPRERREILRKRRNTLSRAESLGVTALLTAALDASVATDFFTGAIMGADCCNGGVGFCTFSPELLLLPHTPLTEWPIGIHGQPFPDGLTRGDRRLFVSLSHSNGHLLAAIAARPVGADVQELVSILPERLPMLDARIRHPSESPVAQPTEFTRRWVAKEATVKLTGEGLTRALSSVVVKETHVAVDDASYPLFTGRQGTALWAVSLEDQPRPV